MTSEHMDIFKCISKDKTLKESYTVSQSTLALSLPRVVIYSMTQSLPRVTCWQTLGSFIAQSRKKGLKGWTLRIFSEDALIQQERKVKVRRNQVLEDALLEFSVKCSPHTNRPVVNALSKPPPNLFGDSDSSALNRVDYSVFCG